MMDRITLRKTRAETASQPRAGTFAPELLLMLFLVFVPILAIHAVAWKLETGSPSAAAGSARLETPQRAAGG